MSHVGAVSSLLFRPSAQQSVVVATRGGVVGAMSTGGGAVASGETRWRQVLPEGERIEAAASYSKMRVMTLSAESVAAPAAVRAWNSKDGSMIWESSVQSPRADVVANQTAAMALQRKLRVQGAAPVVDAPFAFTGGALSFVPDANGDSKADVLAMHGSVVALLSGVDGAPVWSWAAPDALEGLGFAVRDGQVAVVGTLNGALHVQVLRVATGGEVRSRSVAFTPKPDTRNVVVASSAGALLLLDGLRLTTVALFDEPTAAPAAAAGAAAAPAAPKDAVLDLSKEGMSGACYLELLGASSSSGSGSAAIVAVFSPAADKQLVAEVSSSKGAAAVAVQVRNRFSSAKGEDVEFAWAAGAAEASLAPLVRAVLSKGSVLRVEAAELGASNAPAVLVQSEEIGARGGLKHLWVEAVPADKKGPARFRVFLTCVDDSLSLLEPGVSASSAAKAKAKSSVSWTREEALASVLDVQFVELPVGSAESAANEEAGRYPSFFERLGPQFKSLVAGVAETFNPQRAVTKAQEAVRAINATVQALAAADGGASSGSSGRALAAARASTYARMLSQEARASLLSQDYFGFRKLLLVSTAAGKLYALESQTGAIVWMRFLRVGGAQSQQSHEADERVAPVSKVYVLSHHEAVGVVHDDDAIQGSGAKARSHLVGFNPLTGESLAASKGKAVSLDFHVATALVLPHIDSHSRHILLVASDDGKVALYPATGEAEAIVRKHAATIFFYTLDAEAQVLRGFSLQAAAAADQPLVGVQTWLLRFPRAQERLVCVAARPAHETVQSAVRVLGGGDGGYLHKYLNPNMLALATVRLSPAQQSAVSGGAALPRVVPSLKRTTDPSVNVYLVDTVTGGVLEKVVHRGAEGPVTLLQSENSVLAHYYNAPAGQYELSALELFENRGEGANSGAGTVDATGVVAGASSIFQGLSLSSLASLGSGRVAPFNSFVEGPPQTLQQTFTFRSAIKSLGVSQTRRGITSKEYLIGLPSEQLYALPKALVDPRRPVAEPTPLERAEGLIPYSAALPVDKLRVVSHVHAIGGLRGVVSSHALLESTSLVCAYGLDLFCTRINPSQTFDLLNEDFNSPFLIATVTAVFIAIMWTRRMAKAKELATAWK